MMFCAYFWLQPLSDLLSSLRFVGILIPILIPQDIDAAFNDEAKLRDEENNKRQLNQYWNTLSFSGLISCI